MKDNKQILSEAFFKKASYAEKQAKSLPQYTPVDTRQGVSATKIGTAAPAFQVTDTDEVKKRLSGTFGAAFGSNNIKNMASRAVKTFPIIISDNIEPETAVMLKKLMEEQYAEYINLLISNNVVNLSDFDANNPEGNIAIQALDKISGNDFSKSRLANMAVRKDNISMDDIFTNIPLYNLLRENEFVISTGDSIIDTLFENALVVPSEESENIIKYMLTEVETPPEDGEKKYPQNPPEDENKKDPQVVKKPSTPPFLGKYSRSSSTGWDNVQKNIQGETDSIDMARGYHGVDDMGREIYSRLTSGDVVIDEKQFNMAINRSVGEFLLDPKNVKIKDKYEKAMMLMQSRRISGVECYEYCTKRLGIPVSDAARKQMIQQFRASEIRKYGQGLSKEEGGKAGYVIGKQELQAISENRFYVERITKDISRTSLGNALGAGVAGGLGAGILTTILISPLLGPVALGFLGGGAISYAIARLVQKRRASIAHWNNMTKHEGWERVEYLIEKLEQQQEEIRSGKKNDNFQQDQFNNMVNQAKEDSKKFGQDAERSLARVNNQIKGEELPSQKDYVYQLANAQKNIERSLREGTETIELAKYSTFNEFTKSLNEGVYAENINDLLNESVEEFIKDKELVAEFLTEKTLATTTMPMKVQYVQKKEDKDLMMTPSFMARDTYAYGSTEIERKENKDRRYNQPLVMTIKFKERFSDGKYNDNELTAVIGILGKIIRVSSNEMEYILKENAQGNTVEGIFKTGDLKNAISDMLSTSKISKDLKNLPQSGDVWHNLERITTLAAANKISGKRNSNIANAHIIFSQKEIDAVRSELGIDYLRDTKKAVALMKRYSAFTLMVANDAGQRVYIMDDQDDISWNVVPYSALAGKDNGEQLNAALNKMMRL